MRGYLQKWKKNHVPQVGRCDFQNKIFVIGLSGTGTRSLHHAFQMLGISSCHYPSGPEQFDKYQALSDIPVACRFKELDVLYPGAKFIWTTRELESWLGNRQRKPADRNTIPFWMRLNRVKTYGSLHYDEQGHREAYQQWHDAITQHFAGREQDLLVMNILEGDGWDKLCPFINAALDEQVPFPKVKRAKKAPPVKPA